MARAGEREASARGTPASGSPGPGSGVPDAARLTFPDLPRLELEELLVQLVDRAQEVIGTQGRLRGLLRAQRLVTGELALPVVLRRIAQAGRELVGARYAALGVIGPAGGLVEFVHEGMPDDALQRIGHLPQGKGLLGALIDDPRPIRRPHLADDPRSSGLPPGHPPMESFLGVPIRLRDEVFGNIYVAESTRGEFSAEDEELLSALATTAGVAIENARLYESARTRGEWLQASAAVTRQLLAPDADDDGSLQLIAERTQDIADSDLVLLLFPHDGDGTGEGTGEGTGDGTGDGGRLRIEVSVGADAEHLRGQTLPVEGTLAGRVYREGEPARVAQLTYGTGLTSITSGGVEIGPALSVPMTGSGQVHGVLAVARVAGRSGFTPADVDMVASFANQAALAIELAAARREEERATMLDERERIAADLHDHVIQRLFAAGLSLQGFAAGLGPGRSADRLQAVIEDLDETIKQIRTSIFRLQHDARTVPTGVRARVLDVLAQLTPVLGFQPGVRFSGVLESTVPGPVLEDLLAVLREAVTNVGRHAAARSVVVELAATRGRLELWVADDGRGLGTATRRSGLANLRRRAEAHGGTLELLPRSPSGTVLCWTVPLPG